MDNPFLEKKTTYEFLRTHKIGTSIETRTYFFYLRYKSTLILHLQSNRNQTKIRIENFEPKTDLNRSRNQNRNQKFHFSHDVPSSKL